MVIAIWVQEQFLRFKGVHFESFNSRLTVEQEDSLKLTNPDFSITCTDIEGVETSVFLYEKDEEQLYGVTEDGGVVLVQTFVFNPLIVEFTNCFRLTKPSTCPI